MQSRKREEEEREERRWKNEDVKAPKIEKPKETIVSEKYGLYYKHFLPFIMKFLFYFIFRTGLRKINSL